MFTLSSHLLCNVMIVSKNVQNVSNGQRHALSRVFHPQESRDNNPTGSEEGVEIVPPMFYVMSYYI